MLKNYRNIVILGDTLQTLRKLPEGIVDMGITSPPYNKQEKHKGWLVKNVKYSNASDRLPEAEYQKSQIGVLNELCRITKPGGSFLYNHKLRWERGKLLHPMDWLRNTDWQVKQEIIWDRGIAANIRGWRFWQVEERIYWLYKPIGRNFVGEELKSKHALLSSVWKISPEKNNPHPAPFPLELPLRGIFSIMDEKKGLIIDPYCGSGTTLVAAKILGHDYLGIDIAGDYIDYAKKRIRNYRQELSRAEAEIVRHSVNKTFEYRKQNGEFTGKYRRADKQMKIYD